MKITSDSHLDHNLTSEHVEWLLKHFADRIGFFIETVELPRELAPVECDLYGPSVGDPPVSESDVTYLVRGNRPGASRVVRRVPRLTRTLTVIAGPHGDEPVVLYTAYGGPAAPREPFDGSLRTKEEKQASRDFWAVHALVR